MEEILKDIEDQLDEEELKDLDFEITETRNGHRRRGGNSTTINWYFI